jgi:hypothetical protein
MVDDIRRVVGRRRIPVRATSRRNMRTNTSLSRKRTTRVRKRTSHQRSRRRSSSRALYVSQSVIVDVFIPQPCGSKIAWWYHGGGAS